MIDEKNIQKIVKYSRCKRPVIPHVGFKKKDKLIMQILLLKSFDQRMRHFVRFSISD